MSDMAHKDLYATMVVLGIIIILQMYFYKKSPSEFDMRHCLSAKQSMKRAWQQFKLYLTNLQILQNFKMLACCKLITNMQTEIELKNDTAI